MSPIENLKSIRSKIADRQSTEYKICTLLIGECETVFKRDGKQPDVSEIAKKLIKSNKDVLAIKDVPELVVENEFLYQFLPKQLTEEQIREIIAESNETNIKGIMLYFMANYAGQYDARLVSSIAKANN